MADGGVRTESRPAVPRITRRRGLLALAGLGLTFLGLRTNENAPEIPNGYQIRAGKKLDDPNESHVVYKVLEQHPDYTEQIKGPAIRTEPRVSQNNEPPNNRDGQLAPGTVISGITFEGISPTTNTHVKGEWVAYKDSKGNIRFVASKYLEPAPKHSITPTK